jgi:cytochrome c-type biogenesis protein CcmE
MSAKSARISATVLVILGALGVLLWTTVSESSEYYKHVDEVMVEPALWYGKKLQLHGHALDVRQKRDSLDYQFQVENNGKIVRARYSGIVPDTFKDGAEVVIKGTLGPDGFTVAPNGIMAKCPSKYEASTSATGGGR